MGEYSGCEGELDATGMRVAIAVARFNRDITDALLDGAQRTLDKAGAADVDVVWVPGAFELPLVAQKLAAAGTFDAVICIGAVVRGDTPHFEYVAGECAAGVSRVALDTGVPVIFGVLTVNTRKQAFDRVGGSEGHKGEEAAATAIEMVALLRGAAVNVRATYDRIGGSYTVTRTTDPRIAAHLHAALGDARSVLNVGAGTGSYEPDDRFVVAVEPSATMIAQRAPGAAPAVRAVAEALPFRDDTFDAVMGVLTMHHWRNLAAGLAELRRVASRVVLFFFEPSFADDAWIVADYFPEMLELESERNAPGEADLARHLEIVSIAAVPVPADCVDGFAGCFWNRPEAYLDPVVQEGISSFAQMPSDIRARGMDRLRAEIASGEWDEKYGHLRALVEIDLGYRLVVAR